MRDAGSDVEEIAHRFGVGARTVRQRLGLAALAPEVLASYRAGEMDLDAARAFTAAPPELQPKILKAASAYDWGGLEASQIRSAAARENEVPGARP